jgi:hypothetical protein
MTPDTLVFDLVEKLACISVSQDGHCSFLVGNDLHDITNTNLARFLLDTQGWGPAQPVQTFRWPETGGTIQ